MLDKNIVENLKNSPIYAMSLGSKELFHSNFWEWMIKKYPQFATVFFDKMEVDKIDINKIKREQNNRDLTIPLKDAEEVYVIENKFKAYPDEEQLKNYEDKLKDKLKGCLTYMIPPAFDEDEKWTHLSYGDLCKKIESVSESEIKDEFDKAIIDEYCEIIKNLNVILNFGEASDDDSFSFIAPPEYQELRIHDVCSKIMCNRFMQYYTKNRKDSLKDSLDEYNFQCKPDYSKQNANLTIKYQRGNDDGDRSAIGIQIQGNAIRHFVEIQKNGCNVTKSKREIFDKFAKTGWFDKNFDEKEITLLGGESKKSSMNPKEENDKLFNVFKDKNNNGIFIYQYYNIPDNYTYKDAEECFNKALQYVINNGLIKILNELYEKSN